LDLVIQNCAEIKPTPTNDIQISEVGLPELIDRCGLVFKLAGGLDRRD
jgi:hypothetical protein